MPLKDDIAPFIKSKSLSVNSQKSYLYDLQQFCQVVREEPSHSRLRLYEQSLQDLKPAARKRKLSAVNQFLLYLYEEGKITDFYRLKNRDKRRVQPQKVAQLDLTDLYQQPASSGKGIALLILELGLSPSEIAQIKLSDWDREFGVVRINKQDKVRILSLTPEVLEYFEVGDQPRNYLFDNKGQAYSRQWYFNHLTKFLVASGHPDLTAQKLREQYILKQVAAGTDLLELAKKLGLKTPMTLEHYYKDGY